VIDILWNQVLLNPMINVMIVLNSLLFGSFGLAILAFTIIMRIITWPLMSKQIKASREMSKLSPKIQELQKKYSDPRRRQEETMRLYREVGISPVGCIVPMLLQLPIWWALYSTIQHTLGGTPEALVDLSQRLYPWAVVQQAIPLNNHFLWMDLGRPDSTFVLAIIVGLSMYVQQKMTTVPTTDPRQQSTNNMMLFMMPLMFAYFTITVPSGLAFYWAVSNVIGIILQYVMFGKGNLTWRSLISFTPAPAASATPEAPAQQRADDGDSTIIEEKRAGNGKSGSKRKDRRRGSGKGPQSTRSRSH
jgi:YidC/Oxa1 family membrane protein insertase